MYRGYVYGQDPGTPFIVHRAYRANVEKQSLTVRLSMSRGAVLRASALRGEARKQAIITRDERGQKQTTQRIVEQQRPVYKTPVPIRRTIVPPAPQARGRATLLWLVRALGIAIDWPFDTIGHVAAATFSLVHSAIVPEAGRRPMEALDPAAPRLVVREADLAPTARETATIDEIDPVDAPSPTGPTVDEETAAARSWTPLPESSTERSATEIEHIPASKLVGGTRHRRSPDGD